MESNDSFDCREAMSSTEGQYLISVFYGICIVLNVLGNLMVVSSVMSNKYLRGFVSNIFIVSLAIGDIMYGLLSLPVRILLQFSCLGYTQCWAVLLADLITGVAQVHMTVLIALDRYFAVLHPYQYCKYVNRRRAIIMVIAVWGYGVLWCMAFLYNWSEGSREVLRFHIERKFCTKNDRVFLTAQIAIVIIGPLVISATAYIPVLITAVRQIRSIKALTRQLKLNSGGAQSSQSRKNMRELKTTLSLLLVYGTFFVCFFPLGVLVVVMYYSGPTPRYDEGFRLVIVIIFGHFLPPLSSTLNPFIYGITSQRYRRAFRQLFYKITCRPHKAIALSVENTIVRTKSRNKSVDITPNNNK